jgi:two-component system, cell cycle sensor histidine kinase and response regulator CckA
VTEPSESVEPKTNLVAQRPADIARLEISRLSVESGVSLETVFRHVTEVASEYLQVERSGVWLLVDHNRALRCVDLFERSSRTHSSGVTLQLDEFPEYRNALLERKTVPAETALTDPRTIGLVSAYLEPLGIGAMLDASVLVGGELVGVVCNEQVGGPREWTTEERDFAGSMADLVALKIRAAEMEEARIALRTQSTQLAELRRLDSLAEMAAGVAHDINNFLTVALHGANSILAESTDPKVRQSAHLVLEAAQRGAGLTRELMEIAHPTQHSSRVIRPDRVLRELAPLLQKGTGDKHRVVIHTGERGGRVLIAPEQFERLVHNLVLNARDAMPEGGEIVVNLDEVEVIDDSGKPGRYQMIEVVDKGEGIPPHVLPRIFDPFFSTKPRGLGTGLGLAVVNQIAAYAGGFVRVESEPGKGSRFRVYLPWVSRSM